jgi:predicted nucleic acid-binding Zn ribbon protein
MTNSETRRENRATILFLVVLMLLIALSVYGCFYEAWEQLNVR